MNDNDNDIEIPNYKLNKDTSPLVVTGVLTPGSSFTSISGGLFIKESLSQATFQEIIENKRSTPFSRDDFRSFLRKRLIEENLDFCVNISACLDRFKNKIDSSKVDKEAGVVWRVLNDSSNSSLSDDDLLIKVGDLIVNEFIAPGSTKEINLSDTQRKNALESVNLWKSGEKPSIDVFNGVHDEVKTLLEANAYHEFVNIASSMNISVKESLLRFQKGIIYIFIVSIILGVVIWLEFEGLIKSHWWRLISFIPILEAFQNLESYRVRVCFVCAYLNLTGSYDDGLIVKKPKKNKALKPVSDKFAKQKLSLKAKKVFIYSFFEAILFVALVMAIPPYNNF